MTYNDYVTQLKTKARDIFRCKAVARFQARIFSVNQLINADTNAIALAEKDVAIEEYELAQVDTKHPDAENLTKYAQNRVDSAKAELKDLQERIKEANNKAKLKELEEKIAKIENGETPILVNKINTKVQAWLDGVNPNNYPEEFEGSDKEAKPTNKDEDENKDDDDDEDDYTPEDIN